MAAVLSPPHLRPALPGVPDVVRHLRPVGRRVVARPERRAATPTVAIPVPGRPLAPTAATYRRRQAVALLVVATVALLTQVALVTVVTRLAPLPSAAAPAVVDAPAAATATAATSSPTASPGAAPVAAPAANVYVVRSGDTLWSIARRLRPDADPRPLVDALAERAGSSALRPGQRIDLDGLAL